VLTYIDNMTAVTQFDSYLNPVKPGTGLPSDTMRCFAEGCFSCEADIWGGVALAGGKRVESSVAYEDVNAALWQPARAVVLWLCPGIDERLQQVVDVSAHSIQVFPIGFRFR
jgi:hypothetical protein